MPDSQDDFEIVDRSDLSDRSENPRFSERQVSWTDEFDVGTDFEVDPDQRRGLIFGRIRNFFAQWRSRGRFVESGIEIFDSEDHMASLDPFPERGEGNAFGIRAESSDQPRVIETKAISTKLASDGARKKRLSPDKSRETNQGSVSSGNETGDAEDLNWEVPGPFERNFDDDQYAVGGSAIAGKMLDSRHLSWQDILLLPIAPLKWVFAKFRSQERQDDNTDEFAVASKRRMSKVRDQDSFSSGEHPVSGASVASSSVQDTDDLKIGTGSIVRKISDNAFPEEAQPAPERSDHPDDYSVISAAQLGDSSFRPGTVSPDVNASTEITAGGSQEVLIPSESPADPHLEPGINSASSFSGRLQQLFDHSDFSATGVIDDENVEVGVPLDTDTNTSGIRTKSLGNLCLRIMIWFMTIPARCLKSEGDLFEQRRLKIEPFLAALPATAVIISSVLQSIRVAEIDKLESYASYLKGSQQYDQAGKALAAMISAQRSCFENGTPDNRYQVARLYTKSGNQVDVAHGFRLMRLLASPAGGNQADAHLFIANEILRQYERDPAANRNLFYRYLSELRTGFASSPTRYDILERLAEGLATIGEVRSLTSLLVPHLEFWPHGHYFLAQAAFGRGDDVLRKSHALSMVRHFRSTPSELEMDRKFRIRYAISLALAGEFPDAESFVRQMADSSQDAEIHKSLAEKIDLIRIVTRIHEFPANTDQDIEVLGSLLESEQLSQDFEAAVKRQLLRKGPLRPALLNLCRNLYATRKDSFDADDYVFWASVLRQNQQNEEAREFLENAIKIAPENDIALNNLANLLYKLEPVDLNRALLLSESVLKRNPKEPTFLETRGQILTRLGKYQEAVADLTKSLEAYPNVPEIHEALSRCYRNIGLSELADAHQKRYDELKIMTDASVSKAPGTNES